MVGGALATRKLDLKLSAATQPRSPKHLLAWLYTVRFESSCSGLGGSRFCDVANDRTYQQDAWEKLKTLQHEYINHRPHGWLGHLTPREFIRKTSD